MKILICEDDAVSRKILTTILTKSGHEVVCADNGAEAWKLFDREPIRIVVSDWAMPELDGLSFCKKVRERPQTDYTYFILLTAHHGRENCLKAMDAGVDDFLTKPVDREELLIRLRVAERILGYTKTIRELKTLLPICAYCKKVRDDQDYWNQVETFIQERTGIDCSHSICPQCYTKVVKPQLDALRAKCHKKESSFRLLEDES